MTSYLREIDARLRGTIQDWPTRPLIAVSVEGDDFLKTVILSRNRDARFLTVRGKTGTYAANEETCNCPAHGPCYHIACIRAVGGVEAVYDLLRAQEASRESVRLYVAREQSRGREREVAA